MTTLIDLEPIILAIFRDVLCTKGLEAGDDFFASGGDSLLAVEARARIEAAIGREINPMTVFMNPTATECADSIAEELVEPGNAG